MNCRVNFLSLVEYMKACIVRSLGPFDNTPAFLLPKNRIAATTTCSTRERQVFQSHSIYLHKSVMILIIPWRKVKLEKQESLLIQYKTWKNCSVEFHCSLSL